MARVLIGIMSAEGREVYRGHLRRHCLNQLPADVQYVFFSGRPGETEKQVGDVVYLDCDDDYLSLSKKVRRFLDYARAHFEFDFLYKVDDNALIYPERIGEAIKDAPDYLGAMTSAAWFNRCWHFDKVEGEKTVYQLPYRGPYAMGGPGYVLSRKSVETCCGHLDSLDLKREFYEDKMIGDLLRRKGVLAKHRPRLMVHWGDWRPGMRPLSVKCGTLLRMHLLTFAGGRSPAVEKILYAAVWMRTMLRRWQGQRHRPSPGGFVASHVRKFLVVNIAKNASTALLEAVFREDQRQEATGNVYEHFGFRIDGIHRFGLAAGKEARFADYKKFAVYRDPLRRLVSLYQDKCASKKSAPFHPYFVEKGIVGATFEEFLTFVERELRKDVLNTDEHIRRQVDFFDPSDVDWIVPIEHLDAFMRHEFGMGLPRANVTKDGPILQLTPDQIYRIRRLYERDYLLLNEAHVYKEPVMNIRAKNVGSAA